MKLCDKFYGEFVIREPVLLDLLNSPTLLRLKGIRNGGYYPGAPTQSSPITRYDHSIGVFLLLRKFGSSLEEQIAGLIHDVSHSAFSHTIDYVLKDKKNPNNQDHQDNIHSSYIKASDIADIIKKHGFEIDFILDDSHFKLKENELPDICADRIDYSIREAASAGGQSVESQQNIINNLTVYNNSFVFKDFEKALQFSQNFAWCNQNVWSHISTAVIFTYNAEMLRYAMDMNYISYNDFYTLDDMTIINRLKEINDNKLKNYLYKLTLSPDTYQVDDNCKDYKTINCKVRNVDPYFLNNGKLTRVSELNNEYKKLITTSPKFLEFKIKAA